MKNILSLGPYKTSFPSTVIYSILSKATCKLGLSRYGSRWLLHFLLFSWHLYAKMGKCIYFQMPRKVYTVAWPSGLRRWFKAPVSSEAWVRIPPLPRASFYKVNDSPILSSQIEFFFVFFLHSCFYYLWFFIKKRRLINNEREKQKQTEILEKRPPHRDKEKT